MVSTISAIQFSAVFLLILCYSPCFSQSYNSLVITEIMADPTPVVGLPDVEYLELFNRTGHSIEMKNWKLMLGTRSALFPDATILPGEYAIICNKTNEAALQAFGKIIPFSAFSLPNDGSTVSLFQPTGQLVFSVSYEAHWWPAGKRDGGYSMEMIDTNNPCGEQNNWLVSADKQGGTPAKENSVKGNNPDSMPPVIERIDMAAATEIRLIANERLDSLNAVAGAIIELAGRKILKRKLEQPQFHTLVLTLDAPLVRDEEYSLSIKNLSDCTGNLVREARFSIGLPSKPDSGDVVLNEILFNPPEGGVDFIEIYNRSAKYISLKNWFLGNVKNGEPDVFRILIADDFILQPHQYLALTTSPDIVKKLYPTEKPRNFLRLSSMPVYSNAAGGIILANENKQVYDWFDYNENMHDPLIHDKKGISLEKADVNLPSKITSNWHSAASTAGNATPGYVNSQVKTEVEKDLFEIEPEAFMPGNNGMNDTAKIKYKLSQTGKIVTIQIFDINGRLVKNILRNQLIGTNGEISWDGRNDNGAIVPTGYYLVLIDLFDPNGNTAQYKKKVVVVKN
jgi:hypothetical protein